MRQRLTHRNRKAVDGSIPYPGNVNQPDREFKKWDQYHTFKQTVNHELPDMRHEWKSDANRDEIGFGIPEPWGTNPTVPEVKMAADKALKLATLLLGNKVGEKTLKRQASDFMYLGPKALERSLLRFAKTMPLYAEDEEAEAEEINEEEEAPEVKEEEASKTPVNTDNTKEVEASAKAVEAKDAKAEAFDIGSLKTLIASVIAEEFKKIKASEELVETSKEEVATDGAETKNAADEKEEAIEELEAEESDNKSAADEKEEAIEELESEEQDDANEGGEKTAADDDFQLDESDNGEAEPDAKLAALLEDREIPVATASKKPGKVGIKSLPGQPRTASAKGRDGVEGLWEDIPQSVLDSFK